MPEYRRNFVPGGTFFFTVVTYQRQRFLRDARSREVLHRILRDVQRTRPFTIDAVVLLPDHLHMIWTLPAGDADFSTRWASIKANFSRGWLAAGGSERRITVDGRAQGRRGVWQPRFLEHTVRDEEDFIAHVEYIHYNPVKHGLVECPHEWPYSSFHRYVAMGHYTREWCCGGNEVRLRVPTDASWLE